jgi:hypothetical protein
MHSIQTQPVSALALTSNSGSGRRTMFSHVKALFADLRRGLSQPQRDLGSCLGGQAWTDSLERELNNDIAIRRHLRI